MWGSYRSVLQKYESTDSENVVLKEGQSLLRGSFRWKFEWAGLRKCGLQGGVCACARMRTCVCACVCVCVHLCVVWVSQQNSLVPRAPL